MRFLIKFCYDGSDFNGYQKQPWCRTIEEEFEKALYSINDNKKTRIYASGRTDAGVHALCQCAHVDLNINITEYKLKCALNSLLPKDIHVFSTEIVEKNFNARFDVKLKEYCYIINIAEYNPISRKYVYQYNKELNVKNMKYAIKHFIGMHNFKMFVSDECKKDNYVRIIKKAYIKKVKNEIIITFVGTGFMKYQVRNMVGTLIKIGKGKLDKNSIKMILNNELDKKNIFTAPACGLYLKNVEY